MSAAAIPLSYNPPQAPDPVARLAGVVKLKDLLDTAQTDTEIRKQQLQQLQDQNTLRQQQLGDQGDVADALRQTLADGPNGQKVPDYDAAVGYLNTAGKTRAASALSTQVLANREKAAQVLDQGYKNVKAKIDIASGLAQTVHDDDTFAAAVPLFKQVGVDPGASYDADKMKQIADAAVSHKDYVAAAQAATQNAPKTYGEWAGAVGQMFGAASTREQADAAAADLIARGAPPAIVGQAHDAWKTGGAQAARLVGVAAAGQPEATIKGAEAASLGKTGPQTLDDLVDEVVPPGDKDNAALNSRTHALVQAAVARGDVAGAKAAITSAAAEVRQLEVATNPKVAQNKIKIAVATEGAKNQADLAGSGLTADDFQRAGVDYALTGKMPSLGMRGQAVRQRIIHEANQWARDNGFSQQDVLAMRGAVQGDTGSLRKLQAQRDQIASFEQTAGKNLDLFLEQARQLPDTGVPWINTPVRLLNDKLVGARYMPAVNAARQVANNEIAKVTSGGGISGVLSDSARREVEGFNPQNATLGQVTQLADVLRSDMRNRHDSLDSTIEEIKSRLRGAGKPVVEAPARNLKPLSSYITQP